MKLEVFSCDWCGAHAPGYGSVGEGWAVHLPGSMPIDKANWTHLCAGCVAARIDAIEAARKAIQAIAQKKSAKLLGRTHDPERCWCGDDHSP
jgi:hypothetical protein